MATDRLMNHTQGESIVSALQTIAQKSETPYNASNKLPTDYADDTNQTNKFATAAELEQIETNKNNISSIQTTIGGIDETGNNYIELKSGLRLYISSTTPTGTIPVGSIGVGF